MSLKAAHISDLHFSHLCLSPSQFLSKRWIGNLNLLFSRKSSHQPTNLISLAHHFETIGVTHLFISGDLTTTSQDEEFTEAKAFVETFQKKGIQVFAIPGNHDHYTKQAYKTNRFYDYFAPSFSNELPYNLKTHRVAASKLANNLWLVALDCALATSFIASTGLFSEEIEANLISLLKKIPSKDHVILLNHFPLFQNEGPRKALIRADALQKVVRDRPNVKLYLHGHSHRHCIADIRQSGYPILIDCGSTSHLANGSWNLLDLSSQGFEVKAYRIQDNVWECFQTMRTEW